MSDLINQSGQILVVDGIRINGQSDTPAVSAAKSMIAVGNTPAESVRSEFLNRYRCVAEGEKRILSGTTLTAKVYDSTTGNEVSGISESEFTWSDADGNTIATGINHVTLNAHDHMDGKNEKQFILIWEHTVKYFIGTSERAVTVKQNIFFTLTTDTTTEYMWSTAINEDYLDKTSGDWKTTVGPKPNDGNTYYLWTRVSYDRGVTFTYYKSSNTDIDETITYPVNPTASLKIKSERDYFERSYMKPDGSKGDYLPNQEIELKLEYTCINANEIVVIKSGQFSNSIKASESIKYTPSSLDANGSLVIEAYYSGKLMDTFKLRTLVVMPEYGGELEDENPFTINGRAPVDGDSFIIIRKDGDKSNLIVRVYQNGKWTDLESTSDGKINMLYGDVMNKVLAYCIGREETLPEGSGPYQFINNLLVNSAYIATLFSQNIKLLGSMFGGAYNEDGDIIQGYEGKPGFYLDKDGVLKAVQAFLNDVYIKSVDGSTTMIETQKETAGNSYDLSLPLNMWNKSVLFGYVPYSTFTSCVYNGSSKYIYKKDISENVHVRTVNANANSSMTTGFGTYQYTASKNITLFIKTGYSMSGGGSTVSLSMKKNSEPSQEISYNNYSFTIDLSAGDVLIFSATANCAPMGNASVSVFCDIYEIQHYDKILITNTQSESDVVLSMLNESELVTYTLTFSGFNSSSFVEKSSYDRLKTKVSALKKYIKQYTNTSSSYVVINSARYTVNAIQVEDTYVLFYTSGGNKTITFTDTGSAVECSITLLSNRTSLVVCSLNPSTSTAEIGTSSNPFETVYCKRLFVNGTEITK